MKILLKGGDGENSVNYNDILCTQFDYIVAIGDCEIMVKSQDLRDGTWFADILHPEIRDYYRIDLEYTLKDAIEGGYSVAGFWNYGKAMQWIKENL